VCQVAQAGQRHFGENYVQEATQKIAALAESAGEPPLAWHFIGPIQSNKTRPIAQHFQWVHTIAREKIAARLSEQRDASLPPLEALIEVNVCAEASKSGVEPKDLPALAFAVARLPRLRLRGLMAIPEPTPNEPLQRQRFAALRRLMEELNAQGLSLDTLSMGMSADLEAAIYEGATMVRVGTAIFGERSPA
jgi:PLP dependent protein